MALAIYQGSAIGNEETAKFQLVVFILANDLCCCSFSLAVEVVYVEAEVSATLSTKINLGIGYTPKLFLPPPLIPYA